MTKHFRDTTAIHRGMYLTKEAPADRKAADEALAILTKELEGITGMLTKNKVDVEQQYKDLKAHYDGVKADNDAVKAQVAQHVAEYTALCAQQQSLQQALDTLKKEMDAPIFKGGNDLANADTEAAIELQRRAFLFKGGEAEEFKPDMSNLVDATQYRSAVRKLMKVGIESKEKIVRSFNDYERKAFEAASWIPACSRPSSSVSWWTAPSCAPSSWICMDP